MIDRQLLVSPERAPTLGTVTRATDAAYNCEVSFRGRAYECKSAGKNALAIGDSVSFVQIDQTPWVIKSDALYPTRFKRPLTDWAGHHKYNLLLQYLISKGARKNYTFQFGTAQSVVSTNVLRVACWDGRARDLPVEYAGSARPAAAFSAGDQVLLYQKTDHDWVVVAQNVQPAINAPTNIYFGNVIIGSTGIYGSTIAPTNLSSPIVITAAAPFTLSLDGVNYAEIVSMPKEGGLLRSLFSPVITGAFSFVGSFSSAGATTISCAWSGTGIAVPRHISMRIHNNGLAALQTYRIALDGGTSGAEITVINTPGGLVGANSDYRKYESGSMSVYIDQITGSGYKIVLQPLKLTDDFGWISNGDAVEHEATETESFVSCSQSVPEFREPVLIPGSDPPAYTEQLYRGAITVSLVEI